MIRQETLQLEPPQMGLVHSAVLHLFPGACISLFVILIGPSVIRAGYPPVAALYLGILAVLIPLELGFLISHGHKANRRSVLDGIVLYREPLPWWNYALLVPTLVAWGGLWFGLLSPVESVLASTFFSWMPPWMLPTTGATPYEGVTSSAFLVTFIAGIALNGIAGPVVEELYFRGYLLPRISRLGHLRATLFNLVLFSLYHFFSPWGNITRILVFLPFVYLVSRKRNIYLSMWTHCTCNILGMLLTFAVVAGP